MDGQDKDKIKQPVYRNPASIQDIQRSLFTTTGLRDKAFNGLETEDSKDIAVWNIKGGTARYPTDQQHKIARHKAGSLGLLPTPPKLGVSQVKNLDTLGYLLQRENWRRDKAGKEKTGELEFTLKEYAITRGKTEEDLARGGKFLDELKRDLFTGAYTTYKLDRVEIDGEFYTAHGLPNFYMLLEPENPKGHWKTIFNEPYKSYYLNGGQYFKIALTAIQDHNTDNNKGYLYFFFKLVMSYAAQGDFKTQIKVSTLLDKIGIGDAVKARPQEAFNILAECLYYTATAYQALTGVCFFDSAKCKKTYKITDLAKFGSWEYNAFTREVLTPLGLTDIREALISLVTPAGGLKPGPEETGQTGQDKATL